MAAKKQKAFVTGGSRGIGRGIVLELAKRGYDVAFTYHSKQQEAEELVETVKSFGVDSYAFQASLEQPGAGVKAFAEATARLKGLDVLVNNAGITIFENIFDLTEDAMDFMINLDFRNYFIMMREASRYMIKHEIKGSIINITSTRGTRSYPGDCIYGGLKAGLNRAIGSVALDLAPYGIRVNNVAPGAIRIRTNEEFAQMGGVSYFWDEFGKTIPLGRSGLPEDVGKAVVFLTSDEASYITGQTINVDGGLLLPGIPETPDENGKYTSWGSQQKYEDK